MKRKTNLIDVLKIAGIEIASFFLVMIFFQIESNWVLLGALTLVVGVVVSSKFFTQQFLSIKELFASNRPTVLAFLIVLLFLYPLVSPFIIKQNTYWMLILVQTGIYIIVALGLNIQLGSTGLLNLASAGFYGVGGYTAGLLSLRLGLPAFITLPAAGITAALFGLIIFVPIVKARGHYIALVTIAFGLMIVLALDNTEFTGGPQGLMGIPPLKFFGYSFLSKTGRYHFYLNYYYFVLVFVLLVILAFYRLFNSWVGLILSTIRDDEIAAKCCGVNSIFWKMGAFCTGNFLMGVGGAVYAHMIGFISPPNFHFGESLLIVSMNNNPGSPVFHASPAISSKTTLALRLPHLSPFLGSLP